MRDVTENEYSNLDGIEISKRIRSGANTADEMRVASESLLDQTAGLNAIASRFSLAESLDLFSLSGRWRPFAGVPLLLKDLGANIPDHPAGNGAGAVGDPPDDLSVFVQRALDAGFTILGRTTIPPYAADVATYNADTGVCYNPYVADCTPGGSSGGSAAMVAARVVPIAHATDAAGSIRIPASRCGLLGLKPSRGVIVSDPGTSPFYGFAEQFFLTRTARDARLLFSVFSGTLGAGCPRRDLSRSEIHITRLHTSGLPNKPDDVVENAVELTIDSLGKLGYSVQRDEVRVDVDWTEYLNAFVDLWARNVFDSISQRRAATTDSYLNHRTASIFAHGAAISEERLHSALRVIGRASTSVCRALSFSDVIVSPVTTLYRESALPLRVSNRVLTGADQLLDAMIEAPLMSLANISGTPALSVPAGRHNIDGHPVGVQLWSRVLNDDLLLQMAADLEPIIGWGSWHPDTIQVSSRKRE